MEPAHRFRDPSATPHARRRSMPVESLLAAPPGGALACDVLVVGSGYGGSFAAAELAREGRSVWVLERGREYARGDFPETLGELPGHVQFTRGDDTGPRGRRDALFDLRIDDDAAALVGCGLGGGSLINAGVVLEPRREIFEDPRWPRAVREDRAGLDAAFAHVREVLGAAPLASPGSYPKYRALERLAHAMPGVRVAPAPIAVTQRDGPNAVGVEQKACIGCGNCVTGCNHDAKNTLPMNAIPLAIHRGARFWTGANATGVARAAGGPKVPGSGAATRWRVRVERVATLGQDRSEPDAFFVHARVVVIAAGALGSTELLLRSREDGLAVSERIGRRFSGNGDLIAFGFGQADPVDAVAGSDAAFTPAWRPIGPTIVGTISSTDPGAGREPDGRLPPRAVLQDGAMPAALRPLLGTLLSTAGMVHAYVTDDLPAFAKAFQQFDPIGSPARLLDHCQVLLGMGADASDGCLALDTPDPERRPRGERRLRMSLAYAGDDPTIAAVDAALAGARRPARPWRDGFDGGYYVPNPVWKPTPDGGSQVVGELGSRLVTVHPIGGCVMADDRREGVVDHLGTVFDASSRDPAGVHAGLHVLDGAVLPTALGVNPMLTIAAVAARAAARIDARIGAEDAAARAGRGASAPVPTAPSPRPREPVRAALARPPHERERRPEPDRDMTLGLVEVLHTDPGRPVDPGPLGPAIDRAAGPLPGGGTASAALRACRAGLVLKIDASTRLFEWIEAPGTAWTGTATLSVYEFEGGGQAPRATGFDGDPPGTRPVGRRDATSAIAIRRQVASGTCRLHLLRADAPESFESVQARRTAALARFAATRPQDGAGAELRDRVEGRPTVRAEHCDRIFGRTWPPLESVEPPRPAEQSGWGAAISNGADYERALQLHLVWRELAYSASLVTDDGVPIELRGTKRLAYADDAKNVWDALLELDVVAASRGATAGPWTMKVDVLDLLRRGIFRIDDAPDTPTAIAGIAASAALWLRSLAQTHYWSFPGADYGVRAPSLRTVRDLPALVLPDGRKVVPDTCWFEVPCPGSAGTVRAPLRLRVTRYRTAGDRPKPALLLVHGLAHGGEVFVTPTVEVPLAARFVAEGWDVFVLDHRLSNLLGDTPRRRATIDDVARHDIPCAFDAVARMRCDDGPVRVLAHCVGAAATAMAVLAGRLARRDGGSRIESLVLHAVHPWVVPSKWNRVSAALAAFFQDFLGDEVLDPMPPTRSEAFDQVVDRLAASVPWSREEWAMHRRELSCEPCAIGHAVCNRMTLFYGREWRHANLSEATHASLHGLVGPAHVDVFKHIFFLALRQRLTDANGDNVYLRSDLIARHWTFPTLFATGLDNRVFDPASAARSYLLMTAMREFARSERGPGPGRVGVYLPEGLGHMDFLFGRFNHLPADAPRDPGGGAGHGLHDTLVGFLRDPDRWISTQELDRASTWRTALALSPQLAAESSPWVGPLLGYVRVAGTRRIELRVWYEVRTYQTFDPSTWRPPAGGTLASWRITDLTADFAAAPGPARLALPGTYHLARCVVPESGPIVLPRFPREGYRPMDPDLELESRTTPLMHDPGSDARRGAPTREEAPQDAAALARELRGTVLDIDVVPIETAPWLAHLRELLAAGTGDRTMTFLLASCRWPGLTFERTAVDRPVRAMRRRVDAAAGGGAAPVDALFLLGDQIYADALADVFDLYVPAERAARRYREAFTGDARYDEHHPSAEMAGLLHRVPCWSVVDDHEFDDDWPGAAPHSPPGRAFRQRFAAAVAYQWRQAEAPCGGRPMLDDSGVPRGLWQPFEAATLPCFALDTRTERTLRTHADVDRATIIGDAQLRALAAWLKTPCSPDPTAPRLILSGSTIGLPRADEAGVPGSALRADDWHGYPASCRALIGAILDAGLPDVVMLCGDPHYSCVVTIAAREVGKGAAGRRCRVHVIVASGLNASLPFANGHPRELLAGTVLLPWSDDRIEARATATPLSSAPRQFTELSVRLRADGTRRLEVSVTEDDRPGACTCTVDLEPVPPARAAAAASKEHDA